MSKNNERVAIAMTILAAAVLFSMSSTVSIVSAANNTTMHLACVSNMCTVINGSGTNECSTAGVACNVTNQTHLACVNNACVSVAGAGQNQCTSSSQCTGGNQTHLACVGMTCQMVSGAGNNTCSANNDCRHLACAGPVSNRSCQYVAGAGANECDLGEQCEVVSGGGRINETLNATRLRLSPAAIAALPECNSWFKRIFSRSCKNQIAQAQAELS